MIERGREKERQTRTETERERHREKNCDVSEASCVSWRKCQCRLAIAALSLTEFITCSIFSSFLTCYSLFDVLTFCLKGSQYPHRVTINETNFHPKQQCSQ